MRLVDVREQVVIVRLVLVARRSVASGALGLELVDGLVDVRCQVLPDTCAALPGCEYSTLGAIGVCDGLPCWIVDVLQEVIEVAPSVRNNISYDGPSAN